MTTLCKWNISFLKYYVMKTTVPVVDLVITQVTWEFGWVQNHWWRSLHHEETASLAHLLNVQPSNHLSVMLSWDTVITSSGIALLASYLLVYHAMSLVVGWIEESPFSMWQHQWYQESSKFSVVWQNGFSDFNSIEEGHVFGSMCMTTTWGRWIPVLIK